MTDRTVERPPALIDAHFHVGLLGDEFGQGALSADMRRTIAYRIFLAYARVDEDLVCDRKLHAAARRVIEESQVDRVVCLALDPVYDAETGERREDRSNMWVDNDYVLRLRDEVGDKVLLGASVHPFDPRFETRVQECVEEGAVLLKWLPSAQQIDLADPRVGERLVQLATLGAHGGPLPLLLHVGPEYAIPSTDPRTGSYDFLRWTLRDRIHNALRLHRRWHTPEVAAVRRNLESALEEGACIIFAHCGLPYFASGFWSRFLEHSDLETVRELLGRFPAVEDGRGGAYADVSACVTPFRRSYYPTIRELPERSLVFGSDFPTPVFELSRSFRDLTLDFKAILQGRIDPVVIPQDNLIDVNYRELHVEFAGHPMFGNFGRLLGPLVHE